MKMLWKVHKKKKYFTYCQVFTRIKLLKIEELAYIKNIGPRSCLIWLNTEYVFHGYDYDVQSFYI